MTKESFERRVREILWSLEHKAINHDNARLLIVEAYNVHIINMSQDDAEADAEFIAEEYRKRDDPTGENAYLDRLEAGIAKAERSYSE